MAVIHSKDSVLLMGKYGMTGYLQSIEPSKKRAKADTSVLGLAYETSIPGQTSGMLKCKGFADYAVGASHEAVAAYLGGSAIPATFTAPGTAVGDFAILINGYVDSQTEPADMGSAVGLEFEITNTEGLDYGKLFEPLSVVSVTANGTAVDNAAASTNGWSANLHVTAASGTTPSLVVKLQDSADNSSWADVATFTTVTSTPSYEHKSGTGTLRRYARLQWTITGTGPSYTIAAAVARR